MKHIVLFLVSALISTQVAALPEFSRHGYFGCTSCHASPTGGVMLNGYGRSFSAEKVATWAREGEEQPLYGALAKAPEWLMVGGHVRWAQVHIETSRFTRGRFFIMQRDLELGVQLGSFSLVTAGGWGGRMREPDDDRFFLKQGFLNYAINESWSARAGRFFPRYGLMVPQHEYAIRKEFGLIPGEEPTAFEATYASEFLEVAAAGFSPRKKDDDEATKGEGAALSAAVFLASKHRIGANAQYKSVPNEITQLMGLNASLALYEKSFALFEADRQFTHFENTDETKIKDVLLTKLGTEVVQGIYPYILNEAYSEGPDKPESKRTTYAVGLDWHPRPHFHFEGQFGHTLIRENFSYVSSGYLIMHYYL